MNHELCFVVEPVGVFGGPVVRQISRPDIVLLHEGGKGIIIKDGLIYEMTVR